MELDFNVINDDDEVDALELVIYGIPRHIYERANYFHSFDELNFYKRFRLTKHSVLRVLDLIENNLEYRYDLNNCVSPINQLLVTLRFYATGNHLISIADFGGMHTSTVCRIIVKVSRAIAMLYPRFVKMPSTPDEIIRTQTEFYHVAAFPRVIGAVDCTHIKIQSPGGEDPEVFRNRKQYFSLNVQAICNSNFCMESLLLCTKFGDAELNISVILSHAVSLSFHEIVSVFLHSIIFL